MKNNKTKQKKCLRENCRQEQRRKTWRWERMRALSFEARQRIVRRKDYSSVMLCSMRENPARINLSPGDEDFTRCNILQITPHHSDLPLDISPNLTRRLLFSAISSDFFSHFSSFSVSACFIFQIISPGNRWRGFIWCHILVSGLVSAASILCPSHLYWWSYRPQFMSSKNSQIILRCSGER